MSRCACIRTVRKTVWSKSPIHYDLITVLIRSTLKPPLSVCLDYRPLNCVSSNCIQWIFVITLSPTCRHFPRPPLPLGHRVSAKPSTAGTNYHSPLSQDYSSGQRLFGHFPTIAFITDIFRSYIAYNCLLHPRPFNLLVGVPKEYMLS
jgi:hypothetical protein